MSRPAVTSRDADAFTVTVPPMLTNLLRHDTYSRLLFDGRLPQPLCVRYLFLPLQCRVVIFPLNPDLKDSSELYAGDARIIRDSLSQSVVRI